MIQAMCDACTVCAEGEPATWGLRLWGTECSTCSRCGAWTGNTMKAAGVRHVRDPPLRVVVPECSWPPTSMGKFAHAAPPCQVSKKAPARQFFWGIWPMLPSPASRCQLNGVLGLHLAEDTTLSLRDVCFLVLIWLVRCVPGSSGARPQGAPPTQPGPPPLRSAAGGAGVLRSAGRGLGSGHSRPWLPTAPC